VRAAFYKDEVRTLFGTSESIQGPTEKITAAASPKGGFMIPMTAPTETSLIVQSPLAHDNDKEHSVSDTKYTAVRSDFSSVSAGISIYDESIKASREGLVSAVRSESASLMKDAVLR
jgi:hypothetical protein